MSEKEFWLGFSLFPGIGPKKFQLLLHTFGSARSAWDASKKDLHAILGPVLTEKFLTFRTQRNLKTLGRHITDNKTHFVALFEDEYPTPLKQSQNPPSILYIKGDISSLNKSSVGIGIVGTRKITTYGRQVTELITSELVENGCVIISGLALGVDGVAHQTTIDHGGKTIAVLGCGIECCHPSTHGQLYTSIIQSGGAIVSEFPFEMAPTKGSFPSRNRIIAGLSQAIVVTEGAADSGALITAKDGFMNNRLVFAVPGPITSKLSKGPNNLLSQGAILVTSGQDIVTRLDVGSNTKVARTKKAIGDTEEEQRILELLANEQLSFDEIVKKMGMEPASVGTLLSLMEMKGMITNTNSALYRLI